MPPSKPPPGKRETLAEVLKDINETYSTPDEKGRKRPVIITADNAPDLYRIPTGTLGGDYATGGGVPGRLIVEIYGWQKSLKTAFTMMILAESQKICPLCYYYACRCSERFVGESVVVDPEGTWRKKYAKYLGVDLSKVHIIRPDYAEQGIDVTDRLLRNGRVMACVVDTIACLTPAAEIENSTEKWQQGLQARLVNKALRKWVTALNQGGITQETGPALILVNQVRMSIGVMFANPEVLPGGNGQKFASSITLRMSSVETGKDPDDKSTTYIESRIKAEKNKTYPMGRSGQIKLWVTNRSKKFRIGELEEDPQVLELAERFEIIDVSAKSKKGGPKTLYWPGFSEDRRELKSFVRHLKTTRLDKGMNGTPVYLWDRLKANVLAQMMGPDTDQNVRLINPEHAQEDPEDEIL